jgi:hypothetical protein
MSYFPSSRRPGRASLTVAAALTVAALTGTAFASGGSQPAPAGAGSSASPGCSGKAVRLSHRGTGTATFVGPAAFRLTMKGRGQLSRVGRVSYHARALVALDGSRAFGIGIGAFRAPDGHKLRFNFKLTGQRQSGSTYELRAKSKFIGGSAEFTDSRGSVVEQLTLVAGDSAGSPAHVRESARGRGWISYDRPRSDHRTPLFCGARPVLIPFRAANAEIK